MADYVFIDNLTNKGKIGISYLAFENLVNEAILNVPGVAKSSRQLKKDQRFRLNRPIKITIRNGVVHVWLAIEINSNVDKDEVKQLLEKEIHLALNEATEQVPFDIEIKIEKTNEQKASQKKEK